MSDGDADIGGGAGMVLDYYSKSQGYVRTPCVLIDSVLRLYAEL